MGDCWRSWRVWPVKSSGVAVTFTIYAAAICLFFWGMYQIRILLKWKRELKQWDRDLQSWDKDLTHREQVWRDFKEDVYKDLKWKWMI